MLSRERHRQAESEASQHYQRLWKAAYGARPSESTFHNSFRACCAECHRFWRWLAISSSVDKNSLLKIHSSFMNFRFYFYIVDIAWSIITDYLAELLESKVSEISRIGISLTFFWWLTFSTMNAYVFLSWIAGCYGRAGRHPREEEESHFGAEKVLLRSDGVRSCNSAWFHEDAEQDRGETRYSSNDRWHRFESYEHCNVRSQCVPKLDLRERDLIKSLI